MCFSATASFTTAAATGAAGLLCLANVRRSRDLLLAVTPLVFGLQQALEGGLWLLLPQGPSTAASALTYGYLALAQPFWPLFAPLAARTCEPDPRRRRLMNGALMLGAAVAARLTWSLAADPHVARLSCGHVVYDASDTRWPTLLLGAAYLLAVCGPLLASSLRSVVVLGWIVLAGALVSCLGYLAAFQSTWCYFAAAASLVLVGHFYRLRAGLRSAAGDRGFLAP